jgi:hypothetical protein
MHRISKSPAPPSSLQTTGQIRMGEEQFYPVCLSPNSITAADGNLKYEHHTLTRPHIFIVESITILLLSLFLGSETYNN